MPDQAAFTALQNAWMGAGVSTAAAPTTQSSGFVYSGTNGRRLLEDAATVVPASAVGAWTNCSATCRYQGLASGLYSLQVRAVDAAGNAGNASLPYPFEVRCCSWSGGGWLGSGRCACRGSLARVCITRLRNCRVNSSPPRRHPTRPRPGPAPTQVDSSIGQSSFPVWAIVACAAGGAVALALLAWAAWMCCRRGPRRAGAGSVSPSGPSGGGGASAYTVSPGNHSYYSQATSAYSPGAYPTPGSASGAWGYTQSPHSNGYANGHAYGYTNGCAAGPVWGHAVGARCGGPLGVASAGAMVLGPRPPCPCPCRLQAWQRLCGGSTAPAGRPD